MKKRMFTLLNILLCIAILASPAVPAEANGNNINVAIGAGANDFMYVESASGDDLLGPESFCLNGNGGYYILDTAKKQIVSFDANGKQAEIIKVPSDLDITKIAAGDKFELYLLDPSKSIIATYNDGTFTNYLVDNVPM